MDWLKLIIPVVSLLVGLWIGHLLTKRRTQLTLFYEKKIEHIIEFLGHAYTNLYHLSVRRLVSQGGAAIDANRERERILEIVGEAKLDQLVILGNRVGVFVNDKLSSDIVGFVAYQNSALLIKETFGKPEEYPYKEVEKRLNNLRDRLQEEIGYSSTKQFRVFSRF